MQTPAASTKKVLTIVGIAAALALAGCSEQPFASLEPSAPLLAGIHGGVLSSADDSNVHSVVEIFNYHKKESSLILGCTGVLISKNLVLTAGHCIREGRDLNQKMDSSHVKIIYFGPSIDFSKDSFPTPKTFSGLEPFRYAKVDSIRVHPRYTGHRFFENDVRQNDLALIKLNDEIPAYTKPARLPLPNEFPVKGRSVTLYGYGPTKKDKQLKTALLRKLVITVAAVNEANAKVFLKTDSRNGVIGGDSGGPGFISLNGNDVLWGITSASESNGSGAVSTSLSPYMDWIRQAAKELGAEFQ